MCERKFSMFNVVVEFADGSKEVVKYKEFDKTSYKDMMTMYKRVKEEYKDKNCNIKFVGVNKSGEMGVLFTKENIKEVSKEEDREEIKVDESVVDLLKELSSTINKINKARNSLEGELSLVNKQQDVLLHKFESSYENLSNKEKLQLGQELTNIRKKRRQIKNERKVLGTFETDYTANQFKYLSIGVERAVKKDEELASQKRLSCENKVKEYRYIKDSQRQAMEEDLKNKFDRIYVNEQEKIIYCYNKCRA